MKETQDYAAAAADSFRVPSRGVRIGRALLRTLARTSAAAVLLLLVLYFSPLVPALLRYLTDRWDQPSGDVLIVLGADQLGDGTLGVSSYWRTLYAVRAWRAGLCRRIVFSGGRLGYPTSRSLAAEMSQFAIGLGVPATVITLEERSHSTRENALFTAELIRSWPGTRVLLTSDAHMRRSRLAFERAGVHVQASPVPDVGKRWNRWPARWECIILVGVELAKLGYYRTQGWV